MTPSAILPDRAAGRTLLEVADCDGPTFQTEGPSAGEAAMVIRLAGCDPTCPSCEVPSAEGRSFPDPSPHCRRFSVERLASWTLGSATRLVVISGCESLRQQVQLAPLARCLASAGRWVEIETNGTISPDPTLVELTDLFVVSPRLSSLGPAPPINPAALAEFVDSEQAVFTFAVTHPREVDEIAALEQRYALHPIWVMPAGRTAAAVLARLSWLADAALAKRWHLSGPLQALLAPGTHRC